VALCSPIPAQAKSSSPMATSPACFKRVLDGIVSDGFGLVTENRPGKLAVTGLFRRMARMVARCPDGGLQRIKRALKKNRATCARIKMAAPAVPAPHRAWLPESYSRSGATKTRNAVPKSLNGAETPAPVPFSPLFKETVQSVAALSVAGAASALCSYDDVRARPSPVSARAGAAALRRPP